MFSVVIPLYNKELSIRNTIQSVLNQSIEKFELLIINDGSTDKSAEVVRSFTDKRIRLINQKNKGVSAARNRGIREAKYEWIAFLDGDDLWRNNHLSEILKMIKLYPDNKVFTTSFRTDKQTDLGGQKTSQAIRKVENYFREALRGSVIGASRTVINKRCFEKVGYFNEALTTWEDKDMWGRLSRKYEIIQSQHITSIYRIEAENKSFLTFDIYRNGFYHYDFNTSTSEEETRYYKCEMARWLRKRLKRGQFKQFFILFNKQRAHLRISDLFKRCTE